MTSIARLGFSATTYYVWKERYHRIFEQVSKGQGTILKFIFHDIKYRLCMTKVEVENPEREADILTGWGIYMNQQQPALKTCIWEVPAANCFQIKTDGSLNVVAKCGGLIRNWEGWLLSEPFIRSCKLSRSS